MNSVSQWRRLFAVVVINNQLILTGTAMDKAQVKGLALLKQKAIASKLTMAL